MLRRGPAAVIGGGVEPVAFQPSLFDGAPVGLDAAFSLVERIAGEARVAAP